MVWAHPDDEAYLAAGLAQRVVGAGGSVRCVTATSGERGFADDEPRSLAERIVARETELRASLAVIGVTDLELLGAPDGACADVAAEPYVAEIARQIVEFRPTMVVTFGPDGITGHPDHCAVGRWTTEAWERTGVGELLYATHTVGHYRRFAALHQRFGVLMADVPGTPDGAVALRVELRGRELLRKRLALAAHGSQTDALAAAMGERMYRRWWQTETFRAPLPDELPSATGRGSTAASEMGAVGGQPPAA